MDEKTYGPQREVEQAVLRVIAADRYAREEDPHADAESEHADELLALASRDLVDAVNAGDPQEWPIGWACGEVQTWYPNGSDPVSTEPCRLRPGHDSLHDWAETEATEEADRLRAELATLREVAMATAVQVAELDLPIGVRAQLGTLNALLAGARVAMGR